MQIQKNAFSAQAALLIQKAVQLIENYPGNLKFPVVVVGGCLNTGKTTLVNNLLKNNPGFTFATPCPVSYVYGTEFTARLWRKGRSLLISDPRELAYLLKTKNEPEKPEKVEATVDHPFLKLCRLVDPPGCDSPVWFQSPALEQIFAGAGQIVYLFHQRGIQLYDQHFLHRLKELLGQNSYQTFSFWLNCNAGQADGTSLASTKAALRELFGAEIPVHTLNTRDQESVGALALFLQEKLISGLFFQIEEQLRTEDAALPEMLAKLPSLPAEDDFLLGFWTVKEKAGQILACRQAIAELRKQKAANAVLAENNRRNLQRISLPRIGTPNAIKQAGGRRQFAGDGEGPRKVPAIAAGKPAATAWGPFSSGKSTFFNAIMKEAILPAEDKPTTSYLTRLHYGPEKVAVVQFPGQFTFQVGEFRKGKFRPQRQEINALEQYLAGEAGLPEPAGIEIARQGRYQLATKAELINRLEEIKALLSSPGLPGGSFPAGAGGAATAVRLTFSKTARLVYHLERERAEFHRLLSGPLNHVIETVDVFYPAEFFKQATFLDPPGIDSVYAQHRQTCLKALAGSSLLLVFIHGKQLVSASYLKEFRENIAGRAGHLARAGRVLFLINFADTLTALERERAANFVRRQFSALIPNPPLFLISSLAALTGRDGGFEKVLRRIAEIISAREREVI